MVIEIFHIFGRQFERTLSINVEPAAVFWSLFARKDGEFRSGRQVQWRLAQMMFDIILHFLIANSQIHFPKRYIWSKESPAYIDLRIVI